MADNVSAVSYSARLLDSGNLVLFQGDSGSGGGVWQSFDHPTNTLLPNMKLGLDRTTGLERFLTSWKSRDDPSTGEYSFQLEQKEFPQFILFKGSSRVWRIPTWLKPQRTAKAEDMACPKINGTVVNNLLVDELGSLKMVTWVGKWAEFYSVPGDQCVYGRGGANGYCNSNNGQDFECTCLPGYKPRSAEEWNLWDASGGCIKKRKELSMCGIGEGFVKVANTKIPDTPKAHVWMSLSVHECKDECLRNCSCLVYMSQAEGGARAICITWYENLIDVRRCMRRFPDEGIDLYVRVDAVELAQRMQSRRLKRKKVAVVVTSVVLTSLLFIILVGEYSFRLEPNELPQVILLGSTQAWRIPEWSKGPMIAKAENMASSLFNGTQVNNCDEVYASYNWINASKLSTMFVDELGSLKMVTWVGKWVEFYSVQCVAYGQCGAYGYCNSTMGKISSVRAFLDTSPGRQRSGTCMRDASDGCIKKHEELSMCGNGEGFVKVVNAKIPDTSKACVWMGVSVHECKDECLRKCSCLAGLHQSSRMRR
ncbi:hypothetical protein RHSIM_Rhsim11G0081300 [Rhododendron simsii]|uniref:non-specific serine/threonine protein kinase n=1 Tax=Rhododendron simsii TaxID=118357 RepID=A0A834GC60_RHOSS|nr:hypothetical protein RHSIM_Rhsim11G0081300 [Rhododendron simsii]